MKKKLKLPSEVLNRIDKRIEINSEETFNYEKRYGIWLNDFGILIEKNSIGEIAPLTKICVIPGTPSWFLGMIYHRGNVYPLYDINQYLTRHNEESNNWLYITGKGTRGFGFLVNKIPELVNLNQEAPIENNVPDDLLDFTSNAYLQNNKLWYEVSFHKLLLNMYEQF